MHDFSGFLTGRVDISAVGSATEQFLNLLHRQGLSPRRISRGEEGELLFTLPKKSFPFLRTPAFKTGTRIKIIQKRGLFMFLRRFGGRWGLLVGAALVAAFFIWCGRFIWCVEIEGCKKSSELQLLEELKTLGFQVGCRRNIDVGTIENRYLIGNERLSWISINIKGTTAYIEVKEKDFTPEIITDSTPTHLYALRDGVISSITDFSGDRMVEVGEAVSAGDLLISGERVDSYGVVRRVRSIGSVFAKTQRTAQIKVPFEEEIRQKTGREKDFYSIFLGNLKIPLYFNKKISYNEYDIISQDGPLRLGAFALPIRFQKETLREIECVAIRRSEEEAKERAYYQLAAFERDRLFSVEILERSERFSKEGGCLLLQAEYLCEEMIAYEKKIED